MTEEAGNAYQKYGPLLRVWITLLPAFVVLDPVDIQSVLSSSKHTDKLFAYRFMHNFLGKGLITSSGAKWHRHRRLIQPSFHLSVLEQFTDTFAEGARNLCAKLARRQNNPINVTEWINNCVLDILNGGTDSMT